MANRRMFSKSITEGDSFIDLPLTSQALYFHLGMQADDQGFVSPQRVIRMIGAKVVDLNLLARKNFVIPFESGVIVITHWNENNYLQKDRLKHTIFAKEASQLAIERGVYKMYTVCTPSIVEDSIGEERVKLARGPDERFKNFWEQYPNKKAKVVAEKAWNKIAPDDALYQVMMLNLEAQKKSEAWQKENGRYIPHPATWLNQHRWEDQIDTVKKREAIII